MAENDFTSCLTCRYFLGNDLGSCRRYPAYQMRHAQEWCGEWAIKASPIIDITVDVPVMKRGRPAKAAA
jgi:hypothetical protein